MQSHMGPWKRLRSEERGISAVLVVICLVALFGAGVLAVDAGQLWAARRNMVTGTDAGALAEAQTQSARPMAGASCSNTWLTVLNANVGGLSGTPECKILSKSLDGTSGVVMVSGRKLSPARFSGVLGIGDSAAFSATAAMWGYATEIAGLRPMALCTYDPHVTDGLLLHGTTVEQHSPGNPDGDYLAPDGSTDYAGRTPGVVHHIPFTTSCNGAPGNMGWVNLQNYGEAHNPPMSCTSNNCERMASGDLATWLQKGYYGNNVALSSPADCDASAAGGQTCNGDTGAKNASNINCAMNYLMDPDIDVNSNSCSKYPPPDRHPLAVPIILYSSTAPGSSGSNAQFNLVGVAFVRIWGYNLSANNRFLDIEFTRGLFQGVCCSSSPGTSSSDAPPAQAVKICGVDHDPQDPNVVGARCTLS